MRRATRKRKRSRYGGLKRGQKRLSAAEHFRETFLRVGLIAPDTEFNRRAAAYAQESARMAQRRPPSEAFDGVGLCPRPAADVLRATPAQPRPALRSTAPAGPHPTR
jgi:hypothetical protein